MHARTNPNSLKWVDPQLVADFSKLPASSAQPEWQSLLQHFRTHCSDYLRDLDSDPIDWCCSMTSVPSFTRCCQVWQGVCVVLSACARIQASSTHSRRLSSQCSVLYQVPSTNGLCAELSPFGQCSRLVVAAGVSRRSNSTRSTCS